MKHKLLFLGLMAMAMSLNPVRGLGQIYESFETGLPTSYSAITNYELSSGTWLGSLNQVVRGTEGVSNGTYSCQLKSETGSEIISPFLNSGVGQLSFYITASTASGGLQIQVSEDGGENWYQIPESPISFDQNTVYKTFTIENLSVNRVKFYRTGATVYIDEVTITNAEEIIDFDFPQHWKQGSTSLTSYASDHLYEEGKWAFTGGPAMRGTTVIQDGFASAHGTYSWRLKDNSVNWTATYKASLNSNEYFCSFGFDARRWDSDPECDAVVSYSFDGGSTWTIASSIGSNGTLNNAAFNNASDWVTFNQSVTSFGGLSAGQFVIKVVSTNGERVFIDNFTYNIATSNPSTSVFSGNGNWLDGSMWNNGLPSSSTNVTIAGAVTLNSSAICNDITIQDGASLIGAENLTINGTFTMQRTIANDNGWHFLSSPVSNQTIIGSDFVPNGFLPLTFDFYSFDESNATTPWINIRADVSGNVNGSFDAQFVNGRGYLVAYSETYSNASFEFTGTINKGTIASPTLTYNTGTNYVGANLLGNPYPSAIDWSLATKTQFVDNYAYIYNESKSGGPGYESINDIIAPNQGFFVLLKSENDGETFSFTPEIQTHGSTFLKSKEEGSLVKILVGNSINYDELAIVINSESALERDRCDALKFFSFDNQMPQVYAKTSDNVNVSINSIPEINESAVIPVEILVPAEGPYFMSLSENTGIFSEQTVILEDQLNGFQCDLTEVENYRFVASPSDCPDRFLLHFGVVGLGEQDQTPSLNAYVYDNRLYVNSTLDQAQLAVYDLQGRLVMQQTNNAQGLQSVPLNLPEGVYLVRLSDAKEARSVKINVQ